METNVNYTIVGAFIILLVTAIVLAVIWLSSGFSFEEYNTYKVYMQESVSGLAIDSPVEFNGVTMGKILNIKLDKHNPNVVEIYIDVKRSAPVTKGTVAVLTTRGITGYVFITLEDKGTDRSPITIPPGEHYPVIPTEPSIFVRLDAALTDISNGFKHIDNALAGLLSKENLESIKEILSSLKNVSNTLSANTQNLDAIVKNTKKASEELGPFLEFSKGAARTLQTQTLPSANQALTNLEDVARNLNQFTTQLNQNPSMLIRGKSPTAPGPGETP